MPDLLAINGGRIINPAKGQDFIGSIYAVDGKIVEDLSETQKEQALHIDAKGCVVSPGFVDPHVHFREPGQTHKEDSETGSQAAAAGGFTTVICMPNTSPPVDNVGTLQQLKQAIKEKSIINIYPTACITIGRKGENLTNIGSLKEAGAVAITDDGDCVQSNEMMRCALQYASMFNLCVMDHCQDASLTKKAVMHEGEWSTRLGLGGWPSEAEDIIVSRNIILAASTGAHIHLQHISSANAVEIIRKAKKQKIPVTAEVTPHHLYFTDKHLRTYDTFFKVNPPLRTEKDRDALLQGLLDGTIDHIATDHAPHSDYEKDQEFDYAPFGMTGLETSLAVSLEVLYHSSKSTLPFIIDCLTNKPASIFGLREGTLNPGSYADITIFDPDESWTVQPETFKSRSNNYPWTGQKLRGKVKKTFVKGELIYDDEKGIIISKKKTELY